MYDVLVARQLGTIHEPIAHKSMTDQVSEKLRSMILSRQLEPGLRVTQVELAEMLGVSTMPIREALLRLGAEGLIVAASGRSFEIAATTKDGIRDVYWAHGMLAGELAARAWDKRSEKLLSTLRDEHTAYYAALERGEHGSLTEINRRFHAAINSVAASPTLGVLLRNTMHYFPDFSLTAPGWVELASRWQSSLIKEFTDGDRDGARRVSIDCSREAGDLFIDAYWSSAEA
jgi:DNA-binding GntR family transcriptional regulator